MPHYTSLADFKAKAAPTLAELQLIEACLVAERCGLTIDRPTAPIAENTIRADLLRLLFTADSLTCDVPDDGVWPKGA